MAQSQSDLAVEVAICDDDTAFMSILTRKLKYVFEKRNLLFQISLFDTPQGLIGEVNTRSRPFDVYFLDIEMPHKRGTTLSRELRQLDPMCKIIFITSHSSEIFNAFHYRVDAFIPKTLLDERLESEIDSLLEHFRREKNANLIFFEALLPESSRYGSLDMLIRLKLHDIVYFECVRRTVQLHAIDATYSLKGRSHKSIQDEFVGRRFININRGILVNLSHIRAVGRQEVLLDTDESLALSRRQYKTVLVRFMESMRGVGHDPPL